MTVRKIKIQGFLGPGLFKGIKYGLNIMSLFLYLDKEDYILLKQRMDTEMQNLTNKQKH